VSGVTTGWDRTESLAVVVGLALTYSVLAGLWGVVATDFLQFFVALGGAVLLAVVAVNEVGGLDQLQVALQGTGKLDFFPPGPGPGEIFLLSPLAWFAGMFLFQWWAWKNSDGGGIIIQRMSAAKNEKEAVYATLWYNVAHYAIRSWPWILVGLASLVLLTEADFGGVMDHERAYPIMIMKYLPDGLRGLLVASFFAAFMSTADTHMNWGASYVMNDFYRRFMKKDASERHYVWAGRLISVIIMGGAVFAAYQTDSIARAFTFILTVTAGIGVVNLARWFWWRINAWSEISVMAASIPAVIFQPKVAAALDIPLRLSEYEVRNLLFTLTWMVVATAVVWIPVTLLTPPTEEKTLVAFYRRVRPPGPGWNRIKRLVPPTESADPLGPVIVEWLVGTAAILGATLGVGQLLIGNRPLGAVVTGVAAALLIWLVLRVRRSGGGETRLSEG
jgi:SSS family solute:Na+ symporter